MKGFAQSGNASVIILKYTSKIKKLLLCMIMSMYGATMQNFELDWIQKIDINIDI